MKLARRMMIPAAVAVGLFAAACSVSTTGAPCDTRDNCPAGQFCSIEKKCHSDQRDAPCEEDAHCPAGEYCNAGTCAAGEPPTTDAGTDAGADAGADTGVDAGKIECAIADNCGGPHIETAECSSGRCVVTCASGWEDANHDVLKDGCEKETPCGSADRLMEIGYACGVTAECKCGAGESHCVTNLADGMGFDTDEGICLQDCPTGACADSRYRCMPTRFDENLRPTLQSCFKTGKLTGSFTVFIKPDCKNPVAGDGRAGLLRIALDTYNPDFTVFTGCRETSGGPAMMVVQGFKFCGGPTTPCPDILYMYIREDAFGSKTEIPYVNEKGEPNFGAIYLFAKIESGNIVKMDVRGMASGGRVFNILKVAGDEYKAEVDIELVWYELTVCGGDTGKNCPEFN